MLAATSTDASQQEPPRAAVFVAHVQLSFIPADNPVHMLARSTRGAHRN